MDVVIASLLSLILGLLVGYYCRQVYNMLKRLIDDLEWKQSAKQVGVVKPERTGGDTRSQPINLEDKGSGVIRRPTPDEIMLQNIKKQEERARNA